MYTYTRQLFMNPRSMNLLWRGFALSLDARGTLLTPVNDKLKAELDAHPDVWRYTKVIEEPQKVIKEPEEVIEKPEQVSEPEQVEKPKKRTTRRKRKATK